MPTTKQKKPQALRWHPFKNSGELERAAVNEIQHLSQQAINARGSFFIVLAGGTTPRKIYEALRALKTDWRSWHVFFGDERCLPIDHTERNSRMAALAWLDHVDIPTAQIHIIHAENGASIASEAYARIVNKVALFDLVLLGLGEDGHTASLFPEHELGDDPDAPATLTVYDAPKPPPQRVSLSARRLSDARNVMFLITGKNKIQAVDDWQSQKSIPAAVITPENGVDVYIETELIKGTGETRQS